MAVVERENIGILNDKLTVKITKEDYLPAFDKKLKEYSKTANIPGFRKGMVPSGMIKKMYGPSIFNDEVLRTVEKELFSYLNTEKPDIFAQPLPLSSDIRMDMNNPSDFNFDFEIGLKPVFEMPDFAKAKLTLNKVEVTQEMLEEEADRLQMKAGKMTEPEIIDNDNNVLNLLFTESDEDGNPVEGGIKKENSVLLKYFTPSLQKELMGKKSGDHLVFQLNKTFDGDKLEMMLHDLGLDPHDKNAGEKYFRLDIEKLGLVEKREMNEDFFNEVYPGKEIKSEEAFKEILKGEIEKYWSAQSANQLHDQIYHFLVDETKMEFPEKFLKRWLQTSGEKPKTEEEAESEFPGFSNQLKWTLISDKLAVDNRLDVSQEEIREYMKNEVSRYFGQMNLGENMDWLDGYVDRMMKDEKQLEATYRKASAEKLFNWLVSQVEPVEKTVTPDELNAMQHHHHH
ncbi:MAG: trigger factor [Chitinophagaceae bacterium]|nr:trigger factor [Bacteroidota bacterium]MCC6258586.1 trigger factor [Chitinophagaceae bacterium]MCW5915745.1 trigger factor [Ferruginibacter sp.]